MNGRPLDLRWAAENVPAILDIWYPGTQGGAAVADLLFGVVSPSGKLPFSWPRTVGHIPMIYSHTRSHEPDNQARRYWDETSTPQFPFGHGLSYGRFAYADLTVEPPSIPSDGTVTVSVRVTNTSDREAAEVVQLYLHQRHGSASRPVRELKGFQRVVLPAQTSRRVQFTIGPDERRYWNTTARDWVLDRSVFDIWIGGDSTAEMTDTFHVTCTLSQGSVPPMLVIRQSESRRTPGAGPPRRRRRPPGNPWLLGSTVGWRLRWRGSA
jgi:beta-glucosidase